MNHLFEFSVIIILVQIPIVASIIIIGFQAAKFIDVKEFEYFSMAWIFNLLYLCINFIFKITPINDYLELVIGTILDLASMYFFLLACIDHIEVKVFKLIKKMPKFLIILGFLGAGTAKLIPRDPQHDLVPYILMRNIPSMLIDFTVLLLLAYYLKKLTSHFPKSKFLFLGLVIYAGIQPLDIIQKDSFLGTSPIIYYNIDSVGFTLGLAAKFIILVSLSLVLMEVVKELGIKKAFADKLSLVFGRTFHEITPPLLELETIASTLQLDNSENPQFTLSKKAKIQVELMESAIYRLRTILAASIEMYHTDIIQLNNRDEFIDFPIPIDKKETIQNINTLIEIAVINFKSLIFQDREKNFYLNDKVFIKREYGGNCSVFCNSVEMVQVFYNLFKNSYEARPSEEDICEIFIKTKNVSSSSEGSSYFTKEIKIEIEDNCVGIREEIKIKVFEEGFSTKSNNKPGRGFGLNIANTFIKKNKGTIQIESPVINSHVRTDEYRPGTKFIIIFPKVAITTK